MRPFSVELVERALAALEGWGGPEVLRRDRAARARHGDSYPRGGKSRREAV